MSPSSLLIFSHHHVVGIYLIGLFCLTVNKIEQRNSLPLNYFNLLFNSIPVLIGFVFEKKIRFKLRLIRCKSKIEKLLA